MRRRENGYNGDLSENSRDIYGGMAFAWKVMTNTLFLVQHTCKEKMEMEPKSSGSRDSSFLEEVEMFPHAKAVSEQITSPRAKTPVNLRRPI